MATNILCYTILMLAHYFNIAGMIPFMKMVARPCGKQRAIHGTAVNVPTTQTIPSEPVLEVLSMLTALRLPI